MSDINSLYYRKSLKQREIAQSQSKIHKYEKRIERLKDYKRKVANYKEDIFDIYVSYVKGKDNYYPGTLSLSWIGSNYSETNRYMSNLSSETRDFFNKIDSLLDSVCDEINMYQRKIYAEQSIIGNVKKVLSDIGNEIEKLIN